MRSFWSDPYLWIHLAGIAALPIFLEICLLGLTIGDPALPAVLEIALVASIGIAPILWMQWQRPFYIFSLLVAALQPEQLTLEQRKLLSCFKTPRNRVVTLLASLFLLWILSWLYGFAPIAGETFLNGGRGLGLGIAMLAFLGSNLFLQVPISVLMVLLTSETAFADVTPQPVEKIPRDFTLLGWQRKRLLPALIVTPAVEQPVSGSPVQDLKDDPWADSEIEASSDSG